MLCADVDCCIFHLKHILIVTCVQTVWALIRLLLGKFSSKFCLLVLPAAILHFNSRFIITCMQGPGLGPITVGYRNFLNTIANHKADMNGCIDAESAKLKCLFIQPGNFLIDIRKLIVDFSLHIFPLFCCDNVLKFFGHTA